MNLGRLTSRILAVLVIAGLAWHPMMVPAAAKQSPVSATEMTNVSAMSADMACCQAEDKSNNNGCKECPLAMCALTIAQPQPYCTNGIQVSFQTRRLSITPDDLIADGLIGDPPDHPPRKLT